MNVYEKKHDLYKDYCRELGQYDPAHLEMTDEDIADSADYYISTEGVKWKNIWSPDGKELAGFLIIGTGESEKSMNADYTIVQAYIDPKYRGQHLMSNRLAEFVDGHHGTYSLMCAKNNTKLQEIWRHIFVEKIGLAEAILQQDENESEKYKMFYFIQQ